MESCDTRDFTNSGWFAAALDDNLDSWVEDPTSSGPPEDQDDPREDE